MLSANVLEQVRSHVDKIQYPVVLIGSLDDSPKSAELAEMLAELAALSERITVSLDGEDARRPSFVIARPGTDECDLRNCFLRHEARLCNNFR